MHVHAHVQNPLRVPCPRCSIPPVTIQNHRSQRPSAVHADQADVDHLATRSIVAALAGGAVLAAFSIVAALVGQPVLATIAGTACVGVLRTATRRLLR